MNDRLDIELDDNICKKICRWIFKDGNFKLLFSCLDELTAEYILSKPKKMLCQYSSNQIESTVWIKTNGSCLRIFPISFSKNEIDMSNGFIYEMLINLDSDSSMQKTIRHKVIDYILKMMKCYSNEEIILSINGKEISIGKNLEELLVKADLG